MQFVVSSALLDFESRSYSNIMSGKKIATKNIKINKILKFIYYYVSTIVVGGSIRTTGRTGEQTEKQNNRRKTDAQLVELYHCWLLSKTLLGTTFVMGPFP